MAPAGERAPSGAKQPPDVPPDVVENILADFVRLNITPAEFSTGLRSLADSVQDHPADAVKAVFPASNDAAVQDVLRNAVVTQVVHDLQESSHALGAAMASTSIPVSPQMARSLQSAENIWRRVEAEFGMLTSVEVAEILGSRKPGRTQAAALRADGKIAGIKRGNSFRFPGFQFDRMQGVVLPVMADLLAIARDNGRHVEDLLFWMTSPSSFFAELDRPVDHLHDAERLLAAGLDQFGDVW